MKYFINDIIKSFDKKKLAKEYDTNLIGYFLYRKISFIITPLFLHLGISANAVTIFSIFLCIIMPLIAVMDSDEGYILVALLGFLFLLLDHIDGNIARVTGKYSKWGQYLDSFGGVFYIICFNMAIGILAKDRILFFSPLSIAFAIIIIEIASQRFRLYYRLYLSDSKDSPFSNEFKSSDKVFTIKRLLISTHMIFPIILLLLGILNRVEFMLVLVFISTITSFLYSQYIIYKIVR